MNRRGFSLVEVIMAIVLLAVVLTGVARYTSKFLHSVSISTARTAAAEVAQERMNLIVMDPSYTTLAATWAGSQTGFPGFPYMSRVTTVQRITGVNPPRDYTVVTVRVTEPTMGPAIDLTTVVAQP
jgi:prepilin-type N-terminal cleavage/methylation domain-containing protein